MSKYASIFLSAAIIVAAGGMTAVASASPGLGQETTASGFCETKEPRESRGEAKEGKAENK